MPSIKLSTTQQFGLAPSMISRIEHRICHSRRRRAVGRKTKLLDLQIVHGSRDRYKIITVFRTRPPSVRRSTNKPDLLTLFTVRHRLGQWTVIDLADGGLARAVDGASLGRFRRKLTTDK